MEKSNSFDIHKNPALFKPFMEYLMSSKASDYFKDPDRVEIHEALVRSKNNVIRHIDNISNTLSDQDIAVSLSLRKAQLSIVDMLLYYLTKYPDHNWLCLTAKQSPLTQYELLPMLQQALFKVANMTPTGRSYTDSEIIWTCGLLVSLINKLSLTLIPHQPEF